MLYRVCCFPGRNTFAPVLVCANRAIPLCCLFLFALFLISCGDEGANNAANSNFNKSVNSNTTNVSNANTTMPPTIDNASLKAALKDRLHSDAGQVLSEEDWTKDVWMDMPVGRFYVNDVQHSKDAVCLATEELLKQANLKLTLASKKALRMGVTEKTLCKAAVSKMLDATLSTEPIIAAF
jgi:hypothetical protein